MKKPKQFITEEIQDCDLIILFPKNKHIINISDPQKLDKILKLLKDLKVIEENYVIPKTV